MSQPTVLTFECPPCQQRFEAAGRLETWNSAIYGPCQEYLADCPSCGKPAKEYRPKKDAHDEGPCGAGPCGQGPCGSGPCGGGACMSN